MSYTWSSIWLLFPLELVLSMSYFITEDAVTINEQHNKNATSIEYKRITSLVMILSQVKHKICLAGGFKTNGDRYIFMSITLLYAINRMGSTS